MMSFLMMRLSIVPLFKLLIFTISFNVALLFIILFDAAAFDDEIFDDLAFDNAAFGDGF